MRPMFFALAILALLLPRAALSALASAKNAYAEGDFQTAFLGFQALAEEGDNFAQNRLGMLYRDGKGTEQNFEKAAGLFKKAAEDGFIGAYWNLGRLYEEGLGIEQDYIQAFKWYYLGRTRSQNAHALRQLRRKMSPLQKAEAKNLARDLWGVRPSFGSMLPALRL